MQLSQMKIGHTARIVAIQACEKTYRQRLLALGLLPGTEFKLTRIAPLGDPVEIYVRGFFLTLRKNEASVIQIEEVTRDHCSRW